MCGNFRNANVGVGSNSFAFGTMAAINKKPDLSNGSEGGRGNRKCIKLRIK